MTADSSASFNRVDGCGAHALPRETYVTKRICVFFLGSGVWATDRSRGHVTTQPAKL